MNSLNPDLLDLTIRELGDIEHRLANNGAKGMLITSGCGPNCNKDQAAYRPDRDRSHFSEFDCSQSFMK